MRRILRHLRLYLNGTNHVAPRDARPDLGVELEAIRSREAGPPIDLGKRIHSFFYRGFELRLDRDVMGLYRVTVNEGAERRFSFTVACRQGDYETLQSAYDHILDFLTGERRPADLPEAAFLKGHFYGTTS